MKLRHIKSIRTSAFTVVELLVVAVVIALLASLSFVAYNGIQQRARDASAQSALSQGKKLLALYSSDPENAGYPATGNLSAAGIFDGENTTYEYTSDGASFCLTATVDGKTSWRISDANSESRGGCSGHSVDGVSPITNLSINPHVASSTGWYNNNPADYQKTKSVAVTGHPNGITTALKSKKIANTTSCILSSYNIDNMGNTTTTRSEGAWVFTTASGYRARIISQGPWVSMPASTWTYVQSTGGFSGWASVQVCTESGASANLVDEAFATGSIAVAGTTPYGYADGNTEGWIWNGTPKQSTSTGQGL